MKRIFGFFGRNLFRPYSEPIKRISADARKIKSHLAEARAVASKKEDQHEYIDKTEEGREQIKSSQDAFEILYTKNKWDEQQLADQIKGVRRAKWTGWICMWFSILIPILVIIISSNSGIWFKFFTVGSGVLAIINFCSRGLKYSIFEAQLNLRDLISFKEFWAREDKWTWILR